MSANPQRAPRGKPDPVAPVAIATKPAPVDRSARVDLGTLDVASNVSAKTAPVAVATKPEPVDRSAEAVSVQPQPGLPESGPVEPVSDLVAKGLGPRNESTPSSWPEDAKASPVSDLVAKGLEVVGPASEAPQDPSVEESVKPSRMRHKTEGFFVLKERMMDGGMVYDLVGDTHSTSHDCEKFIKDNADGLGLSGETLVIAHFKRRIKVSVKKEVRVDFTDAN